MTGARPREVDTIGGFQKPNLLAHGGSLTLHGLSVWCSARTLYGATRYDYVMRRTEGPSQAVAARLWDRLRTSFWFVPSLMLAGAVALSIGALWFDRNHSDKVDGYPWWLYGGAADGALTVLGTIAGSLITVTGVVFSITIVSLTLASGQFGSRLLQNFMRDTGNQVVLGVFIATFSYSLLVLRSVRDGFVPHVSVTLAVVLVFISVGVLIYFIHHVAKKIQAETIVATVYQELTDAIDRLFNDVDGENGIQREADLPEGFERQALRVAAKRSDYLQGIEYERLMTCAVEHDLVLKVLQRPGDFVMGTSAVLLAWPPANVNDDVVDTLQSAFILGARRTLTQDAEHGVHQLVEIAVRALSPGVNDPFTAMICIDRLGAVLGQLAAKQFPVPCRFDEHGRLCLILNVTSFAGYVDTAFNQIRQHAARSPAVLIRLLETIARVAEMAHTPEQRQALATHATMMRDLGVEAFGEARDREDLETRYQTAMSRLAP